MDYCRKCKRVTKSSGKPKFIKKNNRFRRLSICRNCNTSKNNISKDPSDIEIEELFKPVHKKFETRKFIQFGIDDTWQADLYVFYRPKGKIDDPNYSLRNKPKRNVGNDYKNIVKSNNGFQYILNVIDTFSKYVWSIPLKTKTGVEVSQAFSTIFKTSNRVPRKLHVDKGKEFYNKDVKQLLEKYKIEMYSTQSENKASIIERFHRTLGDKLKPKIYKNLKWLNELPKIIQTYNNTRHRTIKMKPNEVCNENEMDILLGVYNIKPTKTIFKFDVNDRVRLSAYAYNFKNKFKTNWTTEIFTITNVFKSNVNYYKVNDVDGSFCNEELLLTKL